MALLGYKCSRRERLRRHRAFHGSLANPGAFGRTVACARRACSAREARPCTNVSNKSSILLWLGGVGAGGISALPRAPRRRVWSASRVAVAVPTRGPPVLARATVAGRGQPHRPGRYAGDQHRVSPPASPV